MDGMIAPDAQAIPVARHDPDAQLGTAGLQTRSDSRSTAMDRMHSIGVHIIGEAAAAAYTRNDHYILPGNSQCRHDLLHLRKDGIIPATRTPAHFLIRGKIFGGQGWPSGRNRFAHNTNLQIYTLIIHICPGQTSPPSLLNLAVAVEIPPQCAFAARPLINSNTIIYQGLGGWRPLAYYSPFL